jgi:hypothetical protein
VFVGVSGEHKSIVEGVDEHRSIVSFPNEDAIVEGVFGIVPVDFIIGVLGMVPVDFMVGVFGIVG